MNPVKVSKDFIAKVLLGTNFVPSGLVDLNKYFRQFGPIKFKKHSEGNLIVAVSVNFKYGSIVAHGKNEQELDANIKDAILTSFDLSSAYKKEAGIVRDKEKESAYALA